MADVTLTYKGNTIAELSASGSKTIQTAGKYCEADIGLTYVSPGGGGASLPSFMNHLEGGSFSVSSGSDTTFSLTNISMPKGIIVYSNSFDLETAKASKPVLGSYGAVWVHGTDAPPESSGKYTLGVESFYLVNFGADTDNKRPTPRSTRSENRGIRTFNPSTKEVWFYGFGTGEYDFKYNTTYYWIAWD